MQTAAPDREELNRPADTATQQADTATFDLGELWQDLGGSD